MGETHIVVSELSEDLRAEDKEQHNYLKSCGKLYVEGVLYNRRHGEKAQRHKANERTVKVAEHQRTDEDTDDEYIQHRVDYEHFFSSTVSYPLLNFLLASFHFSICFLSVKIFCRF